MDIQRQRKLFDRQAEKYASRAGKRGPDHKWRQRLLSKAKGNILEVSVGAGTNFSYYPGDASITAVDFSPAMLETARDTAQKQNKKMTEFICGNVETLDLPEHSFDTVVSTLSMCAYPNPEHVLRLLSTWCRKDGEILLLEHGVSSNRMIAKLQHIFDPVFQKRVGCHINRDLMALVHQAPVTIKREEHALFGAVHLIWGKPNP
ncbi:class I SAM-dependent methyltransferase [Salibacterium qingdaonense]|uniref:Methyltransferase domain-containing protein n=1 Tax=Salibacterium qingdaonense TaxID=266892 RepID=A0A1I4NF75_9BACI|nr:class I SAM-dependent methyltransferase [Salibacterium qingdaonense]SFM14036.1 Methyltransferase domain-containing protein [Salibacterium qingdaonense]